MRQTFSTTYGPDGPVHNDGSPLLMELLENTYYHLTGRSVTQEGYRVRILSTEDYWQASDEEGYPRGKAALGWCCREKDDGIHMFVNADNILPQALGTVFHEVGHGLHEILTPGKGWGWSDSVPTRVEALNWRAFVEAIAMAFEAANFRILEEHTGVEASALPEGWYFRVSPAGPHRGLGQSLVQPGCLHQGCLPAGQAANLDGDVVRPGSEPSQD